MEGRICAFFSHPLLRCVNGTVDFTVSGREKKDSEAVNMCSISGTVMLWLVRLKKPSVSAAWRSCWVISEMREEKSCREIWGIVRVVYFVGAIVMCFVLRGVGEVQ